MHSSPKQKCLSLSNWHWSLFNASSELLGKSSTAPLLSDIPHSELPNQNNAAQLVMKKKKTRSHTTTSQRTSLATCKILLPVQDCSSCLLRFWKVFTSLSFFISPHLQSVLLSLIFYCSNEKLLKLPKQNLRSFNVLSVSWHHQFGIHCQPLSEM